MPDVAHVRPPSPALHLLHIVDARDGSEPLVTARAALDVPGCHDVILIGSTRDERIAASLGLITADRLGWHGSARSAPAALLRLRRLAKDRLAARRDHEPILIAHGPRAAVAARMAVPKRIPMLATLPRAPHGASPVSAGRRVSLALEDDVAITFDADIAAAWRAADIYDARVLPTPQVSFDGPSRAELRASLGLDDDTLVLATLADPPAAGDARRLASFTGWLYTMDRQAAALVPRDRATNDRFRRGVRFTRLHGRRWGMLEVDLPLPLLLPACDVAILDTTEPTTVGPIIVRAAQAAGVAAVVPKAPWLRRLHQDEEARRTLFAPNATALTMIHCLNHLSESTTSIAAAKKAALRCAAARSDPAAFARELHRLIRERLNLPLGAGDGDTRFVPAALAAGAR